VSGKSKRRQGESGDPRKRARHTAPLRDPEAGEVLLVIMNNGRQLVESFTQYGAPRSAVDELASWMHEMFVDLVVMSDDDRQMAETFVSDGMTLPMAIRAATALGK
jgi:hypothetical protein